ncbi:MAG: hypothetical protein V4488_24990 [Pseudomonadota bacterium]
MKITLFAKPPAAFLPAVLALAACRTPQSAVAPVGLTAELALLGTSDLHSNDRHSNDLHSNILSYDYYKLKEDPFIGFERTLGLIRNARAPISA